jgi:hypothetical protein
MDGDKKNIELLETIGGKALKPLRTYSTSLNQPEYSSSQSPSKCSTQCCFVGSILWLLTSIGLLIMGSVLFNHAGSGKTDFGIKNADVQKGISTSMIVIGVICSIVALFCAILCKKLLQREQDNSILLRRSYGSLSHVESEQHLVGTYYKQ